MTEPVSPTTIAVVGATGYAGGHIVDEALRRGHRVVAVSRHPDAVDQPGVTTRAGSVHDGGLLDELAADVDVLAVAIKAAPGDDGALADAVPTLLTVASRYGTRLAVVGGAGTLHVGSADGPLLMDTPEFPAQAQAEAQGASAVLSALRADGTGADWFFLSPAASFGSHAEGERTGRYRVGSDVLLTDDDGNSNISGADYAIAFVDEVEQPQHHRERFTVAY